MLTKLGFLFSIFYIIPYIESQTDLLNELLYHPGYNPSSIIRPSTFVVHPARRSTPIGRVPSSLTRHRSNLDASSPLPCCKDESGGSICRAMKSNDPRGFAQKCEKEPDFSLVVCCKSCDEVNKNYRQRAANFFSPSSNTTNCFDRMSAGYCSRFQSNTDSWSGKRWSCRAEHYRLGFRVCRATCGFCNIDWMNAPEPTKCN